MKPANSPSSCVPDRPTAKSVMQRLAEGRAILAEWTTKYGREPARPDADSNHQKGGFSIFQQLEWMFGLKRDLESDDQRSISGQTKTALAVSLPPPVAGPVKASPLYCKCCGRWTEECVCKKSSAAVAVAIPHGSDLEALVASFSALPALEQEAIAREVEAGLAALKPTEDAIAEAGGSGQAPPLRGRARAAQAIREQLAAQGVTGKRRELPSQEEAEAAQATLYGRNRAAAAWNQELGIVDVRNLLPRRGAGGSPAGESSRQHGIAPHEFKDIPKQRFRGLASAEMLKQRAGNAGVDAALRYKPDPTCYGRARAEKAIREQVAVKISGSSEHDSD